MRKKPKNPPYQESQGLRWRTPHLLEGGVDEGLVVAEEHHPHAGLRGHHREVVLHRRPEPLLVVCGHAGRGAKVGKHNEIHVFGFGK